MLYLVFVCLLLATTYAAFAMESPLNENLRDVQKNLIVDGTYTACATLTNRMEHFAQRSYQTDLTVKHHLAWRHLNNYWSLLLIALDTMNQSRAEVVFWRAHIATALHRLLFAYRPFTLDAYDYQIDYQMLIMLQSNLSTLLQAKKHRMTPLDEFIRFRIFGVQQMFEALFADWETPQYIIRLIARAYIPHIYFLHMMHDYPYVLDAQSLLALYIPLHDVFLERTNEAVDTDISHETLVTMADALLLSS